MKQKEKITDSLIGKTGRNKGKHWKVKDTSKMNKDKIGKKTPIFRKTGKKKISISTLKRKGENHPRVEKKIGHN